MIKARENLGIAGKGKVKEFDNKQELIDFADSRGVQAHRNMTISEILSNLGFERVYADEKEVTKWKSLKILRAS